MEAGGDRARGPHDRGSPAPRRRDAGDAGVPSPRPPGGRDPPLPRGPHRHVPLPDILKAKGKAGGEALRVHHHLRHHPPRAVQGRERNPRSPPPDSPRLRRPEGKCDAPRGDGDPPPQHRAGEGRDVRRAGGGGVPDHRPRLRRRVDADVHRQNPQRHGNPHQPPLHRSRCEDRHGAGGEPLHGGGVGRAEGDLSRPRQPQDDRAVSQRAVPLLPERHEPGPRREPVPRGVAGDRPQDRGGFHRQHRPEPPPRADRRLLRRPREVPRQGGGTGPPRRGDPRGAGVRHRPHPWRVRGDQPLSEREGRVQRPPGGAEGRLRDPGGVRAGRGPHRSGDLQDAPPSPEAARARRLPRRAAQPRMEVHQGPVGAADVGKGDRKDRRGGDSLLHRLHPGGGAAAGARDGGVGFSS